MSRMGSARHRTRATGHQRHNKAETPVWKSPCLNRDCSVPRKGGAGHRLSWTREVLTADRK
jgi:hypothetical protein